VAADCPAARHLQDLSMEDVRSAVWAYFAGMDLSDTGEALQDLTYDIAAAVLAETIAPGQEATFAFDLRTGAYNVWARPFGGEAWEQVVGELFNPPTNLLDALRLTLN
jgi:hypothetical protein